jgi:hypothetical protein
MSHILHSWYGGKLLPAELTPVVTFCIPAGALAASVVLLACFPPPEVNSAPANYYIPPPSSSSSASYEQSVQQYEPWGLEDDEETEADSSSSSFDMRSHMLGTGEVVQYNQ